MRPGLQGHGPLSGSPRPPLGLAWRLGAVLGLVVLAGAVTLLVVALIVAPQVFHAHLEVVLDADSADLLYVLAGTSAGPGVFA